MPGAREIDLFTAAHAAAQSRAGHPVGVVCDLVSGPRPGAGFAPVNVAGTRELIAGDPVIADVGVGAAVWADSARTLFVGAPSDASDASDASDPEVTGARDAVTEVLDGVAALLAPGTPCSEVHDRVSAAIRERLPGWEFPHHAGHGVGPTVFDDPHLIPADGTLLEAGMVLAVEPGAYRPGRHGVRVEDMFVVSRHGGVRLTGDAR